MLTYPLSIGISPSLPTRVRLLLLSAAALTFEINLTRLFSVAQFYHFAFMIVSLALLGYGASGTALALFSGRGDQSPKDVPLGGRASQADYQRRADRTVGWLALAGGASMLGAFLLTNWLPLDSFSLAWDPRQAVVLALHYLALALPFFFSGLAVGLLLAAFPQAAGQTYAANLVGSALGCLAALIAPNHLGGEGTVVFSSGVAALAALIPPGQAILRRLLSDWRGKLRHLAFCAFALGLLLLALIDSGLRIAHQASSPWLNLRLSPYKGLSYALQYPGAAITYQRWNAFSRVDVVRSPGIRSVPGLSYRYLRPLPPEDGLLVDGDDLSPIVRSGNGREFAAYLPSAVAFRLRPQAETLVLGPRGGLDIVAALALGASWVTAVEVNPLIIEAADSVYRDRRVAVVVESDRSYLRRAEQYFDVIVLSLATSYHPVRSGAYSLAEDYRYTVEAFQDALARLSPEGVLVVTRWLQMPPSESLRTFALAVTALEDSGVDPKNRLVAFRGYNTATVLVKKNPFTAGELRMIRTFAADCAFDLTYSQDIRPEETNRYNILPQSVYYEAFRALLEAPSRRAFYAAYPYEVTPPTDDRPFFSHFFKWSQAGQVWAELGKTWQPFGGAGYFVILGLLALASLFAGSLIMLPLVVQSFAGRALASARRGRSPASLSPAAVVGRGDRAARNFLYFGLLGFAYLLVEIPLIQRFILFLGNPAYAMTAVLFALLLFSGIGSHWGRRISLQAALAMLVVLLAGGLWGMPVLLALLLGLPLALRLGLTVLILAPIGFLMGIPLPGGIQRLLGDDEQATQVPWLWAVNGSASVISAVVAALLALSLGLNVVLGIGMACYAGTWLVARRAAC